MKKIYLFFIFIICSSILFSKEIVFNFNLPVGKIEYFKVGDLNTQTQNFYDGKAILNLEKEEYYFLFIAEDYPLIQKVINVSDLSSPMNITFTKEGFSIVEGVVKNLNSTLGEVQVSFINAENHSYNFTTNIYGEYRAFLPPGNYKVSAKRAGYILKDHKGIIYDFSLKNIPYKLDLNLTELSSYVKGHVVDEEGFAIPYPKIFIKNGENIIETTGDELGKFQIPVNSGIATILCQKNGYVQNGVVRKVEKNSTINNIEVKLTRTRYSISGTVTDDIKALSGVKLQLVGEDFRKIATTTSSENGFFEFYKIPGNQKVFILISENNKIIKKSEAINLTQDIKNFNILIEN